MCGFRQKPYGSGRLGKKISELEVIWHSQKQILHEKKGAGFCPHQRKVDQQMLDLDRAIDFHTVQFHRFP